MMTTLVAIIPKYRTDSEFARLVNQATNVVTDDLAKNLIGHRHFGLATNVIAKLGLYHRKSRLDAVALVVVLQKFGAVKNTVAQ